MHRENPADPARLAVFVYGTLKRGEENHDAFCAGVHEAVDAVTRGRLFHLPAGYPALAIRPDDVLAHAIGDATRDLVIQQEWEQRLRSGAAEEAEIGAEGAEAIVFGERFLFNDAAERLRRLDGLEGFRPGRPSLYHRVLIRTWVGENRVLRPSWTYIQTSPRGIAVPSGRWAGFLT